MQILPARPCIHWEKFCNRNDTFRRVIGILIMRHNSTGYFDEDSYQGLVWFQTNRKIVNTIWSISGWFNKISLCVQTGKSFLHRVNYKTKFELYIIGLSRLIQHQREFHSVQIQPENGKYNLISGWFNNESEANICIGPKFNAKLRLFKFLPSTFSLETLKLEAL